MITQVRPMERSGKFRRRIEEAVMAALLKEFETEQLEAMIWI